MPSTSFSGASRARASCSSAKFPRGLIMRQPWTRGFSLILRISSGRRALTQSSGRTQRWTSMPTLAQRFRMLLSYATPSGRAPTRTMARVGAVPLSRRTRTLGDRASHSASAAGAPRRISAILPPFQPVFDGESNALGPGRTPRGQRLSPSLDFGSPPPVP